MMEGVISTGKEANVYGARLDNEWRAVKIYKTSTSMFRDRKRYTEGDHRVKMGYDSSNTRRQIQAWAEKEFRNLKRLEHSGIPSPAAIKVEENVLLMGLLGDSNGLAYPRLRDAVLEGDDVEQQWRRLYFQALGLMRRLYRLCRLVHADLSEYNMLYDDNQLYIIDVSQSVEHAHPNASQLLRMDIENVRNFFRSRGVKTLLDRQVFDFIVDRVGGVGEDAMSKSIDRLFDELDDSVDFEADNADFRAMNMDRDLDDTYGYEVETEGKDLSHRERLKHAVVFDRAGGPEKADDAGSAAGDSAASDSTSDSGSDDEQGEREERTRRPRGKKHQDKDEKRAHKVAVKDEKHERRKTKMPKHIKKKLVQASSRRSR